LLAFSIGIVEKHPPLYRGQHMLTLKPPWFKDLSFSDFSAVITKHWLDLALYTSPPNMNSCDLLIYMAPAQKGRELTKRFSFKDSWNDASNH